MIIRFTTISFDFFNLQSTPSGFIKIYKLRNNGFDVRDWSSMEVTPLERYCHEAYRNH